MRRFRVYLDKQVPEVDVIEEFIEFPDTATDDEINEECSACVDTMIANDLCTGWEEVGEDNETENGKEEAP